MQSEELKPCPFCGGNNLRFRLSDIEGWIAHVECTDCDDMLGPMSEYKYDDKEDAEKDAAEVWNRRPALEAALSAAEPVEQEENPMRFFADNVDKWGALEWFSRMVDACEDHDRKRRFIFECTDDEEKDIFEISANTSKMVMTSSAFHLARECKDEILSALSAQVQDVAAKSLADAYQKYLDASHLYNERLAISKTKAFGTMRVDEEYRAIDEARRAFDKLAVDIAKSALPAAPAAPAKQEGGTNE